MPVMKFYAPDEAGFLPCEVMAYMLFPNSAKLRNAYLAQKMAGYALFLADEEELESVPKEVLKALLENLDEIRVDKLEKLTIMGSVAGEILLNMIKLSASGEEASVGKATDLGSPYFQEARNSLGGTISSSDSSIERAWKKYKCVAHFWAAVQIRIQKAADPLTPVSPDSYLQELSLAAELARLATLLTNKHAASPSFSSDTLWTLPPYVALPRCTIICHGLDDEEKERVKTYTAKSVSKADK